MHCANSMCSQSRLSTRPSWLDVLSPDGLEWLWKSALIQWSVFTDRTSFASTTASLPRSGSIARENRVIFRTITDDHIIRSRIQLASKAAIVAVVDIFDRVLAAVGAEVRTLGPIAADELDLAWNWLSCVARDSGHDRGSQGELDNKRFGNVAGDCDFLRFAPEGRDGQGSRRVAHIDRDVPFAVVRPQE